MAISKESSCAGGWTRVCGVFLLVAGATCRQEEPAPVALPVPEHNTKEISKLVFPNPLRVDDPRVNDLVTQAMHSCASRNYDDFRLLWSARENPMSRDEFEESWNAVRDIHVRALERARLALDPNQEPENVYVVFTEISLDPAHRAAERTPQREVVLMLVQEHEQWRLARAPKAMRAWVREQWEAKKKLNVDTTPGAGEGPRP